MSEPIVRVGVGVYVFKSDKFLMQLRVGAHGSDSWSVPGGHLEFGESFEETARARYWKKLSYISKMSVLAR